MRIAEACNPCLQAASALLLLLILSICSCKSSSGIPADFQSERLTVTQLQDNVFLHVSQLRLRSGAMFPCNGAIFVHKNEAIVFDTPVGDTAATELILWIETELKCKVTAVVVNHFHVDCLGGLDAFHERQIPSYASNRCLKLAAEAGKTVPKNGFDERLELPLGNRKVVNAFPGHGHAPDNIVSYYPAEKALFGGCMVKSLSAGRGNLKDADTLAWPKTVEKVKSDFPAVEIVIPGHGKPGGPELLDYTSQMFPAD